LTNIKKIFIAIKNIYLAQLRHQRESKRTDRSGSTDMNRLKRYMIERELPGVGSMSLTELCGAARASNQAIDQIGSDVQWQHSYVAGEKTYCIYLAKDEATINKHAELSGLPVSRITEILQVVDPLTANN